MWNQFLTLPLRGRRDLPVSAPQIFAEWVCSIIILLLREEFKILGNLVSSISVLQIAIECICYIRHCDRVWEYKDKWNKVPWNKVPCSQPWPGKIFWYLEFNITLWIFEFKLFFNACIYLWCMLGNMEKFKW